MLFGNGSCFRRHVLAKYKIDILDIFEDVVVKVFTELEATTLQMYIPFYFLARLRTVAT